ncbi:hypothetical protein BJX65DRAFT_311799 [Aspergillus insuetus]
MSKDIEMTTPSTQMGLNLPLEFCLEIISYVVADDTPYNSRQRTLKALRLVDRAFCICVTPELFKSITIRFNGHSSNIISWIPGGIKSLAMSNRRFFVKEICLRDDNPYETPACSIDGTDGMDMDYLEDQEIDVQKTNIKEADNSNSRIYQELPELLSSFSNVTFLEAHMWYSRPLGEDDLFVDIFRPLKEALGSWLLTHDPQKLANVRIIDERQASPSPPFFQNLYQSKAETQISRYTEQGNEQAISPDQLDCAFTHLRLEHDSQFESWTHAQTRFMPPFIRNYTDISDFDEKGDGNDNGSASSFTQGSAAPQGGYSSMAALAESMDIEGDFEEDTDEDMEED